MHLARFPLANHLGFLFNVQALTYRKRRAEPLVTRSAARLPGRKVRRVNLRFSDDLLQN